MGEGKMQDRDLEKRQREQRLTNAYRRIFDGEEGRLVLEDLVATFRLEERVFTPVKKGDYFAYDPLTAALSDGARSVVIYIRKRLAAKVQGDGNLETKEKTIR